MVTGKKKLKRFLCTVLCLVLVLANSADALAAILAFETQFDYDSANVAWLTDLVIKEDMATVNGLASRTQLVPKPEYPYTETPESLAQDVAYYCALYNLSEGSQRAAYLYFFEILTSQAGVIAGDVGDEDIRTFLESFGIEYPDEVSADERIVARALYTAIATGAFSSFSSGASLEEVMVSYLASVSGMNMDELRKWMPGASVLSLSDYILAASKLSLWTNGYDVDEDTDEDTVFRYIAVMTIEQLGISVDSNLSFDQLKLKYMAAMLGTKYKVTVDSAKLGAALEEDNVPFYVLQLIGKKKNLAVTEENSTYEEAFELVAENTGAFDLEEDEFYADIPDYEARLQYKRNSIWIYPTAYVTNNSSYTVSIDVNGVPVRNGYYTEITLDPLQAVQTLHITVTAVTGSTSKSFEYNVTVIQGTEEYIVPIDPNAPGQITVNPYLSSDSIVTSIMATLGMDPYVSNVMDSTFLTALAAPVKSTLSNIAPTFVPSETVESQALLGLFSNPADGKYLSVLDQMGALSDVGISGIDGVNITGDQSMVQTMQSMITFR